VSRVANKLIAAAAGAGADTGDDDFANVILLLDGDGTNGAANNTFTDSSTNNFTVTESGSVVQGSFSPYGDNWSNYFEGTNDYFTFSSVTAAGTGDVTVEFWFWASSETVQYRCIYDSRSTTGTDTGFGIFQYGKVIEVYGDGKKVETAANAFSGSEWVHFALVRSSGSCQIYINGTASGSSATYSDNLTSTARIVGDSVNTSYDYYGYISNLRETHTAVYTSNFTAPTAPFAAITGTKILTCSSNRFEDESTNGYSATIAGTPKVTPFSPFKNDDARDITTDGGSANFNQDDLLTIADNSALDVSGAMTAEAWIYVADFPDGNVGQTGQGFVITRWVASAGQRSWGIFLGNNGQTSFYVSNTGGSVYTISSSATGAIKQYQWHHIAVSWDGSNQRLFIDGDLKATTANTAGPFSTTSAPFCANALNTNLTGTNMDMYIADARYFSNAAIYTANFTPPTSPLSATVGANSAAVLLNFQDAGIYDYAGINNLDTAGDAQIDTAVKKYGTGSIQFDGTGDYIEASYVGDVFDFDTGDWTLECWVYLQSDTDSAGGIIEIYSNDNNFIRLFRAGGPDIQLRGSSGGTQQFDIQSSAQSQNTWIHVAGVRDGSTIRLFVNGTQVGTDTSFSIPDLSDARVLVGLDLVATDRYFTGYIDDLRVTKGLARYTADFTPPTEALPKF
jgi:hypothetical protein